MIVVLAARSEHRSRSRRTSHTRPQAAYTSFRCCSARPASACLWLRSRCFLALQVASNCGRAATEPSPGSRNIRGHPTRRADRRCPRPLYASGRQVCSRRCRACQPLL